MPGSGLILTLALPFAPQAPWPPLASSDMLSFGALGVFGVAGHLLLTKAYAMAPAPKPSTGYGRHRRSSACNDVDEHKKGI
jgi:drug/metabolite transporter (DMT)-like permease